MTNLSKAFCDQVCTSGIAEKDDRIRGKINAFGISVEDAMLMDIALIDALKQMSRIMGESVDKLPPHLHQAALRNFVPTISDHFARLGELVMLIDMGLPFEIMGGSYTPGCDCEGCVTKRELMDEINAIKGGTGGNASTHA